jgi:hypothetical protein
MAHKTLAIIAALSLVGILFLVYLAMTFESPEGTRTMDIEQPVPRPAEPLRPVPLPETEPSDDGVQILPPAIVDTPSEPEPEPEPELPLLNDSDSFVLSRLASMELGAILLRLIAPDELIRKFVVYVDNVANDELPQLDYPVRPVEQDMQVREVDDNLYVMEAAAHSRFDTLINTLISLDVNHAMRIYRSLLPLFREAYAELGYPDPDFDAVLIEAIDTVLNARIEEGPYQLIRPRVMYQFAEGSIESLTPVEKQLIRIGPENTDRLQQKLREYRRHLTLGTS